MTEFLTRLVHGRSQNDNNTGAVNVPIYTSSTYAYETASSKVKYDYSRSGNPTRNYLEEQVADLENGTRGFAFSSGVAAIHAVLAIFKPGDHIIISRQIYGGTFRLIHEYFERWGIETTPVDMRNPSEIEAAVRDNTKAVYFETFSNPLLEVTSVRKVSEVASRHGLLTIVDNTFLTPYLQQPLDLGADIVIHSATKYLSGHSDVIAGVVAVRDEELAERIYFNQNALGGVLSPEDSNLVRRGIQTLGVRMDRHLENAEAAVHFLVESPCVKKVFYPGLEDDPGHEVAGRECRGFGGIVSFEVDDSVNPEKFVNGLKLIQLAVSLGAVESLIELPSKMTHAELSEEEQRKAGITPGLVRLSVGIEDAEDIIADLRQALEAASENQGR